MAIWLRSDRTLEDGGRFAVGTGSDVIPRAEFGAHLEIDQSYAQLAAQRQALVQRGRDEAAALIEAAQGEAQAILQAARREYEAASEHGYRDGERRALAEWMERLAQACVDARHTQLKMRERLAEIVTVAVEQIVRVQQSESLFEQALTTVDRIVEGTTYLRVAVSPVDHESASLAFNRLSERWRDLGRPFPLTVVIDKRLAAGSCICESDFGVVDASLATQLRAMRTAVARALKRFANDADGEFAMPSPIEAAYAETDGGGDGNHESGREPPAGQS
jgi:type III secretion protein L